MGSSYSIEDIEEHINNLKYEVESFDSTITSGSYRKLQKELIHTNARLLKVKKSLTLTSTLDCKKCDKMLDDLNRCLHILTTKVTRNSVSDVPLIIPEKTSNGNENVSEKSTFYIENDSSWIETFDEQIKNVEKDIDEWLRNKSEEQKAIISGKLKIIYTNLALTKTALNKTSALKKNELLEKVLACYKQLQRETDDTVELRSKSKAKRDIRSDSDYDSDFNSDFDSNVGSYRNSSQSNRSSSEVNFLQYSNNKKAKQFRETFNELVDLENVNYEVTSKNTRVSTIDDVLKDLETDNPEQFFSDFDLFVKQLETSFDKENSFKIIEDQAQVINRLHDIVVEIGKQIENFQGSSNDEEYFKIKQDLEFRLKEIQNLDDLGDESLATGKKEHEKYVIQLLQYFEDKVKAQTEFYDTAEQLLSADSGDILDSKNSSFNEDISDEEYSYSPIPKPVSTEKSQKHLITTKKYPKQEVANSIKEESNLLRDLETLNEDELNDEEDGTNYENIYPPIVKSENNIDGFNHLRIYSETEDAEYGSCETVNEELLDQYGISNDFDVQTSDTLQASNFSNSEHANSPIVKEESSSNVLQHPKLYRPINLKEVNPKLVSVDCTRQIEKLLEEYNELVALNETFKKTKDNSIYLGMQEKLIKLMRGMFDLNKTNFNRNSLVLYDIISEKVQKFVNEL